MYELLYVSGLTGPPSGSAQLYKTIVTPYCHLQYVELSKVHFRVIYRDGYVHGNYKILNYKNCKMLGHYNYMYKSGYKPC